METVCFDGGHNLIKAASLESPFEVVFPHAQIPLDKGEVEEMARDGILASSDMMSVDGNSVMIGQSAEMRPAQIVRRQGPNRWQDRAYMRAFLAGALVKLLPKGSTEIDLIASFPPGDVDYKDLLGKALAGRMKVTTADGTVQYYVRRVRLIDEPTCGVMNRVLNDQGGEQDNSVLDASSTLVLDIGGGTTSGVQLTSGGNVVYPGDSFPLGIANVMGYLTKELRRHETTKGLVMGTRTIAPDLLRDTLRTGKIYIGGDFVPAEAQVEAAVNTYLKQFDALYYTQFGGAVNFDKIFLTGGGFVSMWRLLVGTESPKLPIKKAGGILKHRNVFTATDDLVNAHLANLRGMKKIAIAWRNGELEAQNG